MYGPGHMTKMATTPIYGKKPSKIFYRTNSPMIMKLGMEHYILKLYKVYINDDRELTLTYFTTMSHLAKLVFCTYSRPRYQVSVYRTIGPLVVYVISFLCNLQFPRHHSYFRKDFQLLLQQLTKVEYRLLFQQFIKHSNNHEKKSVSWFVNWNKEKTKRLFCFLIGVELQVYLFCNILLTCSISV